MFQLKTLHHIPLQNLSFFPSPNQLFSVTLKAKVPPSVPIPAPALISPVGFSSTFIFITFKFFSVPLEIYTFYFVKNISCFNFSNRFI